MRTNKGNSRTTCASNAIRRNPARGFNATPLRLELCEGYGDTLDLLGLVALRGTVAPKALLRTSRPLRS
jgi:hypothetical protein